MTPVELSEVIRNYGIVLAGVIGITVAIWRAIAADRQSKAQRDQVRQARREHAAEMFANAVASLDNEKLHIRLGAIYALREIMVAYPEQEDMVKGLLEEYLREINYDGEPPADVKAIMTILAPRARPSGGPT